MHTRKDLNDHRQHVGCTALWYPFLFKGGAQVYFPMRVKDVRFAMGRIEYLVEPIGDKAGGGSRWMNSNRLEVQ